MAGEINDNLRFFRYRTTGRQACGKEEAQVDRAKAGEGKPFEDAGAEGERDGAGQEEAKGGEGAAEEEDEVEEVEKVFWATLGSLGGSWRGEGLSGEDLRGDDLRGEDLRRSERR